MRFIDEAEVRVERVMVVMVLLAFAVRNISHGRAGWR